MLVQRPEHVGHLVLDVGVEGSPLEGGPAVFDRRDEVGAPEARVRDIAVRKLPGGAGIVLDREEEHAPLRAQP